MEKTARRSLINLSDTEKAVIIEQRETLKNTIDDLKTVAKSGVDVTDILEKAESAHRKLDAIYSAFVDKK